MNKEQFLNEIKEILLIENDQINQHTAIEVDSMSSLLLIAFFDENFSKSLSQEQIKGFKTVNDLLEFVGTENFQ